MGSLIRMRQASGQATLELRSAELDSAGAELSMLTSGGNRTVHIQSEEAAGNGAELTLSREDGTNTILFDAQEGLAYRCRVSFDGGRTQAFDYIVEFVSDERLRL